MTVLKEMQTATVEGLWTISLGDCAMMAAGFVVLLAMYWLMRAQTQKREAATTATVIQSYKSLQRELEHLRRNVKAMHETCETAETVTTKADQ